MATKKRKEESKKSKSQVLQDHKKVGKKLLPPLIAAMGDNLSPVSWYHDLLPEFLWLALLCDQQGYRVAVDCAIQLSDAVNEVIQDETRRCGFCQASDYELIEPDERDQVIAKIEPRLKSLLDPSIGLIAKFYPEFPMNWLVSSKWMTETSIGLEGLEDIKNAIRPRTDRTGKPAMECQVLAWVMEVKSGKLKIPEFLDPNLISEYPNSDESREMAATVRAYMKVPMMLPGRKGEWSKKFWRHSFVISACEYPPFDSIPKMSDSSSMFIKTILEAGEKFNAMSETELDELWNKANVDLSDPIRSDVIAGLLARNLQFACDIVNHPALWVMPTASILIRCMMETEIRLKWLIKCGTHGDFEQYVQFGLGQEKLLVEHYKRLSKEDRPDRQAILDDIEAREAWINDQLFTVLLPVDIGGGTQGKDLRTLAEEAGLLELHRIGYSPLSSAVHGHWNTIARLNLSRCLNPLHGGHRLPILASSLRPVSPSCAVSAVEIYARCYRAACLELTGEESETEAVSCYLENIEKAYRTSSDESNNLETEVESA